MIGCAILIVSSRTRSGVSARAGAMLSSAARHERGPHENSDERFFFVTPRLVPGVDVDGRVKPGHDDKEGHRIKCWRDEPIAGSLFPPLPIGYTILRIRCTRRVSGENKASRRGGFSNVWN